MIPSSISGVNLSVSKLKPPINDRGFYSVLQASLINLLTALPYPALSGYLLKVFQ